MIYIDSSVALSQLLLEIRTPIASFWAAPMVSSRLLEYEIWNRIYAYGFDEAYRGVAKALLDRLRLIDLTATVLERALRPFPAGVRTLDGLHLATMDFLLRQGEVIELASYDNRMLAAARALGIPLAEL